MPRFPGNEMISLVGEVPRLDLAESFGPNLRLTALSSAFDGWGLDDLPLGYGTVEGDARLRRTIADLHGVAADDVVLTVGGAHALFLIAFILSDRGSEAVVTTPLFPTPLTTLEVVGSTVKRLRLDFDRGYQPDLAELRPMLSPRTRLVYFASPQNPSGVAIPRHTLSVVLAMMAEQCPEAYLLVDETFRMATYGDDPVVETAVTLDTRVISVASMSKCHGAPGLRIGWAITRDAGLRQQLVLGKFNTTISCSPVDEALALKILEGNDHSMPGRRRHLAEGLARTAQWVEQNERFVDWIRPDAGAICCIRLKRSVFDDAAVARFQDVLASTGVRVANGSWFREDSRIFRLGFGLLSAADLDAALHAVAHALRQVHEESTDPD